MHDIEVLRSFAVLNRAFLAFFSNALATRGLSYSEGVMLANVGHHPGVNQDTLSVELIIDKAAVARAVKSLKHRGLVRVKRSAEDRRANNLFLTRSGEATARFIDELNDGWIRSVTSEVPAAELKRFFKVLGRLVKRVRAPS